MKKTKKIWAVVLACVCALALSVVLVGCGGGNNEDAAKNFIGSWKMVSAESGGEVLDSASLELMESMNMSVSLELNEDGTGKLDLYGEESEVKWSAKDAQTASITVDGQTTDAKLENGQLHLAEDGDKLVFEKK